MAARKKSTPVKESATTENIAGTDKTDRSQPSKKTAEKKPVEKKPRYAAAKANQYHPFQRVPIPTGAPGVFLEKDSWLESQLAAGIIVEI